MTAALRSLGFAARFVSGYLHLADDDDDRVIGGNTHAWVQMYVPGPGWIDFDPSSGLVGNQNLVRVAVVTNRARRFRYKALALEPLRTILP
jgi:transglutaminase-like putative cysteine protease